MKIVKDECYLVRVAVAKHGRPQDLDILVRDENVWVRYSVSEQGRPQDLDILVHDTELEILWLVIKIGRPQDIEILKDHPNERIQEEAQRKYNKYVKDGLYNNQ